MVLDSNIISLFALGGCKTESDAGSIGFVLIPPTTPAANLQIWLWIFCVVTLAWILSCAILIGRGIALHLFDKIITPLTA